MTWSVVGHGPTGADPRSSWKTNPWRLLLRPAKPLGSLELLLGAGAMVKACESPGSYPQQYGFRVQHPSKSEGLSQRRTGIRLCSAGRLGMRMHLTPRACDFTILWPDRDTQIFGCPSCPQKWDLPKSIQTCFVPVQRHPILTQPDLFGYSNMNSIPCHDPPGRLHPVS